ncbi:MAG: hypothetical protein K2R98_29530 [Gemmataceae bacterium]|nr:hypothetical protein [Gemmataceae bacterium]
MFVLLVIFVLLFASLAVFLFVGALVVQGYIYSEPAPQMYWRAPAAAGILTGFIGLWTLLNLAAIDPNQSEIPYDTLFRFNPTETRPVREFWSVKKEGQEEKRTRFIQRGTGEYYDEAGRPWQRSDTRGVVTAIVVDEKGQELRFEPQLTRDGNFKQGSEKFPGYFQKGGRRSMIHIGQVSLFRWGLFIGNLFLNALFFGLWFVCLWLILRFQWPHALGLAVVFWLTVTLVVLPIVLAKTYDVVRMRAVASVAADGQVLAKMCMISPSVTM